MRLRKAGGTYKGLCPFHQEKTPSFTVSPARGTYKCFGCGEGGDAIAFVEKLEQRRLRRRDRDAREALRRRARVRGDLARGRPRAHAAKERARRSCSSARRCSTSACSGTREQGAFAREYLAVARPRRGGVPRSSGSATRRAAPTLTRRRAAGGLHARRPARGRAREQPRQRLLPRGASSSRSPTRAATCAASRRAGSTTTTACRRST